MSIHGAESMHRSMLRKYRCDACGECNCECFTESEIPPTRCCMQFIPAWRQGP